jgi:hypothetical protein
MQRCQVSPLLTSVKWEAAPPVDVSLSDPSQHTLPHVVRVAHVQFLPLW